MPLTRIRTREGDGSEMDSSSHPLARKSDMPARNIRATKGKFMRSIILAAAAALIVPPAAAAPNPAAACSQGELTRIRVSKIKPGGTLAGFRQAVAAHGAWYKAHGFKLN